MFKRDHHLRIATVLQALDAEALRAHGCLFGGGTAIVLTHGEYRESVDIDFLISDLEGYRKLRQLIKIKNDLSPLIRQGLRINVSRDVRTDQYGIRTMIKQGNVEIKFEIIFEGRVSLDSPNTKDIVCGVPTLTPLDMATSKLLANSDRWSDDSVFSRDLIDLAMLTIPSSQLQQAIRKAQQAYGESIKNDLIKAIETLKERRGRLNECMSALKMDIPEALLWDRIRKLNL